eukprot:6922381-Alexandrium_andersonii.AAC.1
MAGEALVEALLAHSAAASDASDDPAAVAAELADAVSWGDAASSVVAPSAAGAGFSSTGLAV